MVLRLSYVSWAGRIYLGGISAAVVRGLPTSNPSVSVIGGLSDGWTLPLSGNRREVTVGRGSTTVVVVVVVVVVFWSCRGGIHGRAAGTPNEKRAYHFAIALAGVRGWIRGWRPLVSGACGWCTVGFPDPCAGSIFGLMVAGSFYWFSSTESGFSHGGMVRWLYIQEGMRRVSDMGLRTYILGGSGG